MTESHAATESAHEATAASSHTAAPVLGELFSVQELETFDHDDVVAGSAIGKMLATLFLYTVIAMSLVTYWTWSRSIERKTTENAATALPD